MPLGRVNSRPRAPPCGKTQCFGAPLGHKWHRPAPVPCCQSPTPTYRSVGKASGHVPPRAAKRSYSALPVVAASTTEHPPASLSSTPTGGSVGKVPGHVPLAQENKVLSCLAGSQLAPPNTRHGHSRTTTTCLLVGRVSSQVLLALKKLNALEHSLVKDCTGWSVPQLRGPYPNVPLRRESFRPDAPHTTKRWVSEHTLVTNAQRNALELSLVKDCTS